MATIDIKLNSAIHGKTEVVKQADIPDPISNEYGFVELRQNQNPQIKITKVDDGLAKAGVTSIKTVFLGVKTGPKGDYVECQSNRGEVGVVLSSRPWLADLINSALAIQEAIQTIRTEYWSRERAEYRATVEAPLIDKMNAEAMLLRDKIPAGAIEVEIKQIGDADGYPLLSYRANLVDMVASDVTMVGCASAIRPGAMNSFADVYVGYTTLELIAARSACTQARADAIKAEQLELTTTVVPAGVMVDYRRYKGNAEKAWECGDESAWAAINNWSPFIEAQGLR